MPEVPLREIPTLDEVERQLVQMWSELAKDGKAVLRAGKMNLVVVPAPGDALAGLLEDLGKVTDMSPGRVLVVSVREEQGADSFTPWIAAHCHMGPGGHPVCSEQVVLEVAGAARERVPEAVRRLLVSDMPVFVWWRAPVVGQRLLVPILELADRFILNSATQEDEDRALPVLAWMTGHPGWRGCVGDLAWMRTEPWREIVAAMFDDPDARSGLPGLRAVQIDCAGGEGCGSPGLYLAGWLASRLGWTVERPDLVRRPDGELVQIELRPGTSSVPGRITQVRLHTDGGHAFEASRTRCEGPGVRVVSGGRPPSLRRIQPLDDLALLHGELQRDGRDPVFEAALRAAAALSGGPAAP